MVKSSRFAETQLLEQDGPVWYQKRHHDQAEIALRLSEWGKPISVSGSHSRRFEISRTALKLSVSRSDALAFAESVAGTYRP